MIVLTMEEQTPRVSVIVPCFNVAPWVEAALRSLVDQGLTAGQMEVLALDDGSQDETPLVLQRLASELPFLRVISSDNHGPGWQRNRGISLARGEYVYFLDSDDLLCPGALKWLADRMTADRLDVIWFDADTFYDAPQLAGEWPGYETYYHRSKDYPQVMSGRDLFTALRLNNEWLPSPCLQMVRRDLLVRTGITFPENCTLEDNLYSLRVAHAALRAGCVRERLYRRRIRSGSIMTDPSVQRQLHAFAVMLPDLMTWLPAEDAPADPDHDRAIRMLVDTACTQALRLAASLSPQAAADLPPDQAWVIRCARLWDHQRRQADTLFAENQTLKTEKAERWKMLQAARKDLEALRAERQDLIRERGELKKERGERWNENEAIKKALNARIRDLNEEKQALRDQLRAQLTGIQDRIRTLEAQRKDLMAERHYLREQLAQQFTLMDRARRSLLVRAGMRLQGLHPEAPPPAPEKDKDE